MKPTLFSLSLLGCLAGSALAWDNGDGTYSNPMIPADYPDCEVIRVDKDYYYLSSTFHWVPGDPLLHSRDLVNWKPVGFAFPDYKWDKRYELDGGNGRYGNGSWAPTLRYHNGMFYAACFVWTEGQDQAKGKGQFVVSRAKSPEGPWEMNLIDEKLYDPGLFFDDDGRVYVFHGQNNIFVTELDKDLRKVITPPKQIYSGHGYFEGSHAYKINGMYYVYNTGGGQHCLRSKDIYGPYEQKDVLKSELNYQGTLVHQGALIDTPTGEWWTILFEDRGKHGRIPFLLPVKWEDGWPMVQPVMTHKKPDVGGPPEKIDLETWRSDTFDGPKLGLQWQWNHHPVDSAWSLTERPGFLRLHTTRVTDVLRRAQNTLGQQMLAPDSGAVLKIDVAKMKDGDYAGLGVFCSHSSSIGVVAKDGGRHLAVITEMNSGGKIDKKETATAPLTASTVWLRVEEPYLEYAVNYSYSLDGKTFTPLGEKLGIPYNFFNDWLAPRYCIYNYATKEIGGYVDVDSFDYILPKRQNNLYAFGDSIDAQFCDAFNEGDTCRFKWIEDGMPNIYVQNPGLFRIGTGVHGPFSWMAGLEAKKPGAWVKFNRVDFGAKAGTISVRAQGQGQLAIHLGDEKGPVLAEGNVASDTFTTLDLPLKSPPKDVHPITVTFTPENGKTVVLRQLTLK